MLLPFASLLIITYLVLVRFLRYRRRDSILFKYGYTTRESFKSMTLDDAYAIYLQLIDLEFPWIFSISVFFALFKTYGIPSISQLLVSTGQLASPATASKRAADTGVLLTEVFLHHPSSWRAIDGIARMNYLHDRYRRSGKISDDDMLYTLSLFALEPIRWAERFDWRILTDIERCAAGTYWRNMGTSMEIPFSALPSGESGWTDGFHFLQELEAWSIAYEVRCMVPASTNREMANGTLDIALSEVPAVLKGAGLQLMLTVLDRGLRKAMLFDEPSALYFRVSDIVFGLRMLFVRHLALPRPYFMRKRWFSDAPNTEGYIHAEKHIPHPWYVKPTFFARWGPEALVVRLLGGVLPGDEGDKFVPQGYRLSELGPDALKGKGAKEMDITRNALRNNPRLGCPFATW